MALDHEITEHGTDTPRKQRRQEEERRRMAYRRAIEDYRDSQALQALLYDFPELTRGRASQPRLY